MLTQNQTNISSEVQRQIRNEVYIEEIDDVLAEYAGLFTKYPSTKHDQVLLDYYEKLSLIIRKIRFGIAGYKQQDIDDYLRQARAAKNKAEALL